MKTFKNKIKKYSFWTGLSAAVVMLCNAIAKCFGFSINDQIIEDVIMSICGVLVAFGVVCMPIKKDTEETQEDETETIEIEDVENQSKTKDDTQNIEQQQIEKKEKDK